MQNKCNFLKILIFPLNLTKIILFTKKIFMKLFIWILQGLILLYVGLDSQLCV